MSASDAMTDLRAAHRRIKEGISLAIAEKWPMDHQFALDEAREHIESAMACIEGTGRG